MVKTLYLEETDSTNDFLRQYTPGEGENMTVVWTDFQRKGRGQGTNHWESEAGKNLTFSVLIHPDEVLAKDQYIISMAVAETIHRYLSGVTNSAISIKWPNDIYVGDFKIAGILIENSLSREHIRDCIIGIGLNVNQTVFESDAPNPISLRMIENKEWNREEVLQGLTEELVWQFRHFHIDIIREKYRRHLYRREGIYPYRDAEGEFEAELIDVENDGHLVLLDVQDQRRRYAFKEVAFVI